MLSQSTKHKKGARIGTQDVWWCNVTRCFVDCGLHRSTPSSQLTQFVCWQTVQLCQSVAKGLTLFVWILHTLLEKSVHAHLAIPLSPTLTHLCTYEWIYAHSVAERSWTKWHSLTSTVQLFTLRCIIVLSNICTSALFPNTLTSNINLPASYWQMKMLKHVLWLFNNNKKSNYLIIIY